MPAQDPLGFTLEDEMDPTYCRRCHKRIPAAVGRAQRGLCATCLKIDAQFPAYTFGGRQADPGTRVTLQIAGVGAGILLLIAVVAPGRKPPASSPTPSMPTAAAPPRSAPAPSAPPAATMPPASPSSVDLNAAVRFDGAQFIIANGDGFDWTNVRLTVNEGFLRGGYVYEAGHMGSGQVYTVGAMQFAEGDGERFNPFTHKPKTLSIHCDTSIGARGHWFGGF